MSPQAAKGNIFLATLPRHFLGISLQTLLGPFSQPLSMPWKNFTFSGIFQKPVVQYLELMPLAKIKGNRTFSFSQLYPVFINKGLESFCGLDYTSKIPFGIN